MMAWKHPDARERKSIGTIARRMFHVAQMLKGAGSLEQSDDLRI